MKFKIIHPSPTDISFSFLDDEKYDARNAKTKKFGKLSIWTCTSIVQLSRLFASTEFKKNLAARTLYIYARRIMVARLNFVSHFVILFKCSKECVCIKKKRKKAFARRIIFIFVQIYVSKETKFDKKIPRLSFDLSYSLVEDTSRTVFWNMITILKIFQIIISLKFRIFIPSISYHPY